MSLLILGSFKSAKAISQERSKGLTGIERSKKLNAAALRVAQKIGPIDFDPGKCDPLDVTKTLKSDYVKKKLGL